MKTKDLILKQVKLKGSIVTSDIEKLLNISRQAIAQHLRELIVAKKLIKLGSTHNARYIPYSLEKANKLMKNIQLKSRYLIKGLSEDKVFNEITLKTQLNKKLKENVYRIINYSFTEMLNNSIDHSKSSDVTIDFKFSYNEIEFKVTDSGIGVFESLRKKFKLKDHFESVEHLLKGKQTTDPKRHSGQGIFFTSKIADRFIIESGKLRLVIDNKLKDVFLEDIKNVNGTKITFNIKLKSKKDLKALFDEYSGENYEFDKTKITVHLSAIKENYISRSEAKRLLFGLDKFQTIILDFKDVKSIGQGFADEIFRVYKSSYLKTDIQAVNMSKVIEFMVKRVDN